MASGSVAELGEPGVGEGEQPMAGPRRNVRGIGGARGAHCPGSQGRLECQGRGGVNSSACQPQFSSSLATGCFCFASRLTSSSCFF